MAAVQAAGSHDGVMLIVRPAATGSCGATHGFPLGSSCSRTALATDAQRTPSRAPLISSHGIGSALASGTLAAEAVTATLAGDDAVSSREAELRCEHERAGQAQPAPAQIVVTEPLAGICQPRNSATGSDYPTRSSGLVTSITVAAPGPAVPAALPPPPAARPRSAPLDRAHVPSPCLRTGAAYHPVHVFTGMYLGPFT